jgi:hypothetical protein
LIRVPKRFIRDVVNKDALWRLKNKQIFFGSYHFNMSWSYFVSKTYVSNKRDSRRVRGIPGFSVTLKICYLYSSLTIKSNQVIFISRESQRSIKCLGRLNYWWVCRSFPICFICYIVNSSVRIKVSWLGVFLIKKSVLCLWDWSYFMTLFIIGWIKCVRVFKQLFCIVDICYWTVRWLIEKVLLLVRKNWVRIRRTSLSYTLNRNLFSNKPKIFAVHLKKVFPQNVQTLRKISFLWIIGYNKFIKILKKCFVILAFGFSFPEKISWHFSESDLLIGMDKGFLIRKPLDVCIFKFVSDTRV